MPSEGLTAEQVTFAIRELGFGAMIYSRNKYADSFNSIISTYIESGIPVVAVLSNGKIGHAVNIIGREIAAPQQVIDSAPLNLDEGNGQRTIIDFNKI